ncbi:MAG: TldD/PmbA family protein [Candidatus Methanofastidiosia archaeon]|jgi:predicted Zn-dependent protease
MKDEVLSILNQVIKISTADQVEAYYSGKDWGLTRFANSYIHQHVEENNAELTVRAIFGKKIGKAKTNQLDPKSVKEVVKRAEDIAKAQTEIPDFESLPSPVKIPSVTGFFKDTAAITPHERVTVVKSCIDIAESKGIEKVSGTHYTGTEELAAMNSLGIEGYFKGTISAFKINAFVDEGTGMAQYFSRNHKELTPEKLTEKASNKALDSRKTEKVPPGTYEVILEEQAACEFIGYLAMMAFGAQAYQEGRSAFSGNIGEKMVDESVSIWDDGLNPEGFPVPFDVEGVPKHKVDIIKNGVANSVVYDSYYAQREDKHSTGHAVDVPAPVGPFPTNLFFKKGSSTTDELISQCDKGILVTRFHYTNPMHRLKTIITGMTRDGTFLIENGEITTGLKNMRFTQNILKALSTVQDISNEWGIYRMEYIKAATCAPALHLKEFTFTGSTLF